MMILFHALWQLIEIQSTCLVSQKRLLTFKINSEL